MKVDMMEKMVEMKESLTPCARRKFNKNTTSFLVFNFSAVISTIKFTTNISLF